MTATLKQKTNSKATIAVHLDETALAPHVEATYNRLRKGLRVAGFRPGKAPNPIVERELGASAVQNEVLDAATTHSYAAAVREHDLAVIAQPDVKLTKFVPYSELEYEATVELLPPIKLADYKKLSSRPESVAVQPAEIDEVIDNLLQRLADRQDVDRPAQSGDEVVIDFDGSKGGQPVPGAKSQNYPLRLGSGAFIPGFEDELIGLKAGDTKGFDITFPKDYSSKELAGQKVHFEVKVHRVVAINLPPVDDNLAQKLGPYDTVAALRRAVEGNVLTQKTAEVDQAYERQLLDELIKQSRLEVPAKLISDQADRLRHDLADNLKQRGQTIEQYAAMQGTTPEKINQEVEPEARRRVELALILTEIAKAEQISVAPAEIDAEIERLKQQYQDAELRRELERPETREEVYNHLMASRTINKIKEYNKVEDK